jgi:hypothetical protein
MRGQVTVYRRTPTRTDHSGEFMTERMGVEGGKDEVTLDEVLLMLKQAEVTGSALVHTIFLSWVRPATEEEKQEHRGYNQRRDERMEQWERETLARLKRKYETIHYSDTEDMGS